MWSRGSYRSYNPGPVFLRIGVHLIAHVLGSTNQQFSITLHPVNSLRNSVRVRWLRRCRKSYGERCCAADNTYTRTYTAATDSYTNSSAPTPTRATANSQC